MKKVFKTFSEIGICEVKIEEVFKRWDEKCFIAQYNEQYTLKMGSRVKAQISKEQALEIIKLQGLNRIQSSIFNSASTWFDKRFIKKTIEELEVKQIEAEEKMRFISRELYYFRNPSSFTGY